jgi:phage terminase large subunit-like protein
MPVQVYRHDPALLRALNGASSLQQYAQNRPLDFIQWTPPQSAWLRSRDKRKLLRAGNQIGKTWCGLAEVIWRATGTHPYIPTRVPPVEIWIVCTTWPQSVAIMKKFWELCPKNLIRNKTFDPRYGFGKDNPAVVFECGSVVRFRTTNQGAEALAGATVDYILIDEPTSEEVYRELDRRVLRRAGDIGLTLTPINRPVEYLRQLVRDGAIFDVHAKLTVANLTPIGAREPMRLLDGTLMDEVWIAEQRRLVLQRFQPVVLDGEWEQRIEGAVFSSFDVDQHVVEDALPEGVDLRVHFGFDYGEGDFRDVGMLAAVDKRGDHPRVHLLDEFVSDGTALPEEQAVGILGMLDTQGWKWKRDVTGAVGDKPTTGRVGRKSNTDLAAALERELRKRGELKRNQTLDPSIRQAKTGRGGGAGSVWRGVEWLHRAMLRPGHFTVDPRCERTIVCLQKWEGDNSEFKDPIDAARYATWPYAMRGFLGARAHVTAIAA